MCQWPARSTSASPAAGWCHSSFAPCRPVQLPVVVHHRASALYGPRGAALPAVALPSGMALTGSASASRVAPPGDFARPLKRPREKKGYNDSSTEEESGDSDEGSDDGGRSATAPVSSSAPAGEPSAAALPPLAAPPYCTSTADRVLSISDFKQAYACRCPSRCRVG